LFQVHHSKSARACDSAPCVGQMLKLEYIEKFF
jgi:hypothetical protein